LAFFYDFYFVICLSSPSILVVYDTDNKLSLLARSLSLSGSLLLSVSEPPSPRQRGSALGRVRTAPQTRTGGDGESLRAARRGKAAKFVSLLRKKPASVPKNDGEGGSSAPKSLRIPPKRRPPGPGDTPRVAGSAGEISVRNSAGLRRGANLY